MQRIATATRAVDLFGAGKHGFRAGNLATGTAPTDLSADFFNNVQEELLAVIEAAGLTPNVATLNQVLTAMRSPGVFTNPDQFDETTRAATTAWVSGAGVKFGFVVNVSTDVVLAKTTAGKMISVVGNTTGIVVTLPDCVDMKIGSTIRIQNSSPYLITVARQNSNTLLAGGTNRANVFVAPGDYVEVTALGTFATAAWMVGGTAALRYSSSFASTLSASGIARRPDGLIEQWGAILTNTGGYALLTFGTAFPTAQVANIVSLHSTIVNSPYIVGSDSGSTTGIQIYACNTSGTGVQVYVHWRAWGN